MECKPCQQNNTSNSNLFEQYGFAGNYSNVTGKTVDDEIAAIRNNGTLAPILVKAEAQVPSVYGFTDKNSIDFKKAAANLFLSYYKQTLSNLFGQAAFTLAQQQQKVNIYINAVKTLGSGKPYTPPVDTTFGSDIKPATPIDVKPVTPTRTVPVSTKPVAKPTGNTQKQETVATETAATQTESKTWVYVLVGLGAVVLIGGGYLAVKHFKRKK